MANTMLNKLKNLNSSNDDNFLKKQIDQFASNIKKNGINPEELFEEAKTKFSKEQIQKATDLALKFLGKK